jgi:hypothetical protein
MRGWRKRERRKQYGRCGRKKEKDKRIRGEECVE